VEMVGARFVRVHISTGRFCVLTRSADRPSGNDDESL